MYLSIYIYMYIHSFCVGFVGTTCYPTRVAFLTASPRLLPMLAPLLIGPAETPVSSISCRPSTTQGSSILYAWMPTPSGVTGGLRFLWNSQYLGNSFGHQICLSCAHCPTNIFQVAVIKAGRSLGDQRGTVLYTCMYIHTVYLYVSNLLVDPKQCVLLLWKSELCTFRWRLRGVSKLSCQ